MGKQFKCIKKKLKTIIIYDFKEHDIEFVKFISTGKMKLLRIDYRYLPAWVVGALSDLKGKLIIRDIMN